MSSNTKSRMQLEELENRLVPAVLNGVLADGGIWSYNTVSHQAKIVDANNEYGLGVAEDASHHLVVREAALVSGGIGSTQETLPITCDSNLRLDVTSGNGVDMSAYYGPGWGRFTSLANQIQSFDFKQCTLRAGAGATFVQFDDEVSGELGYGERFVGGGRTIMIGGAGANVFDIFGNQDVAIGGLATDVPPSFNQDAFGANVFYLVDTPGATVVGGPGSNSYLYYSYTNPSFTYDDFLAMNTTYDPAVDHTMGVYFTSEFGGTVLWNSGF